MRWKMVKGQTRVYAESKCGGDGGEEGWSRVDLALRLRRLEMEW